MIDDESNAATTRVQARLPGFVAHASISGRAHAEIAHAKLAYAEIAYAEIAHGEMMSRLPQNLVAQIQAQIPRPTAGVMPAATTWLS